MGYNFQDDKPQLGGGTLFYFGNGASAPTLVKMPPYFNVSNWYTATSATGITTVFLAPPLPSVATLAPPLGEKWVVLGVNVYFDTASTSGVVDIQKVASGTANSGGTSILSSTISTASGAQTNIMGTLATNVSTLTLAAGNRLIVKHSGTQTNLVDLNVSIYVGRV